METLERRGRNGTIGREEGSLNINLNSPLHRDMSTSVIHHANALDITPQAALTRAWWFYLASYEKAAVTREGGLG